MSTTAADTPKPDACYICDAVLPGKHSPHRVPLCMPCFVGNGVLSKALPVPGKAVIARIQRGAAPHTPATAAAATKKEKAESAAAE